MDIKGLFGGSIPLLNRALDLRSVRHNLIASNIANKDTPHYKAFDLMVEKEMERAVNKENGFRMRKTHSGHIIRGSITDGGIQGLSENKRGFYESEEGNTVDLDSEMGNLTENSLKYTVSAQILSKKLAGLKNVIQGGGG